MVCLELHQLLCLKTFLLFECVVVGGGRVFFFDENVVVFYIKSHGTPTSTIRVNKILLTFNPDMNSLFF